MGVLVQGNHQTVLDTGLPGPELSAPGQETFFLLKFSLQLTHATLLEPTHLFIFKKIISQSTARTCLISVLFQMLRHYYEIPVHNYEIISHYYEILRHNEVVSHYYEILGHNKEKVSSIYELVSQNHGILSHNYDQLK